MSHFARRKIRVIAPLRVRPAARHRPIALLVTAILLVAVAACQIDTVSWDDEMARAEQAYLQQRYDEAERLFLAAVIKAEAFQAPDARLQAVRQRGKRLQRPSMRRAIVTSARVTSAPCSRSRNHRATRPPIE